MATGISSSRGSQISVPDKANASNDECIDSNIITDVDFRIGEKNEVADEEAFRLQQLRLEEKVLERKLRKRIDLLIMPLVIMVYMLNYINRNNYAAAKPQDLEKSLSLDQTEYQIGLPILFVGYILMQAPSKMLLNYMSKPSLYLGFWIVVWGLVSALTSR